MAAQAPFVKFMSKKDFHPGNFYNLKKVWEAQEKAKDDVRRERELQREYEQEQNIHEARGMAMMSRDEQTKLQGRHQLNFMYQEPPGYKDPNKLELKTQEVDMSQLTYQEQKQLPLAQRLKHLKNAPRVEGFATNDEARDKPFGMTVRNVRCLRCGAWGHQNVDRECPMFGKAAELPADQAEVSRQQFEDPAVLMKNMQQHGFTLSQTALGPMGNPNDPNQQLLEEDPEEEFLASLTKKQKKRLYRRLEREERRARKLAKQQQAQDEAHSAQSKSVRDRSPRYREERNRARTGQHSSVRSGEPRESHRRPSPSKPRVDTDRRRHDRSRSPVRPRQADRREDGRDNRVDNRAPDRHRRSDNYDRRDRDDRQRDTRDRRRDYDRRDDVRSSGHGSRGREGR
eukprot:m.15443 g.15443  ORF g.15443 m.15443 type:complete len:399 (-) comp10465_c0_seq2:30-1226(-)